MNHRARYPYLNCIDGIEQQTQKISVKWINRFKQWVWVGQRLQKSIILGLFKSEGLEESIKYGCLTTSALHYRRSESVFPTGAQTMAFKIVAEVAHFVFTTLHQLFMSLIFSLFFIRKFHIELCHSRPTTYFAAPKITAIFMYDILTSK